ncbi:TetR/AcrR family transcriptional regulator [Mycobacterium syngnathidarum]
MKAKASDPPPRRRRTGDEVRSQLKAAASVVFAERGYTGATTKQIAARAGVTEALIFRHFGSKAELVDEAVLDTFERFVTSFSDPWPQHLSSEASVEDIGREYVSQIYEFIDDNRQLFLAMMSAESHHQTSADRLHQLFARLEQAAYKAGAGYGLTLARATVFTRLNFAMVLAAVVYSDILFPISEKPSATVVIDELTSLMLHGVGPSAIPPTR